MQLKFSTGIAGGLEPLPEGVTPAMEKQWRQENGMTIKSPRWHLEDIYASGVDDAKKQLR